MTNAYIEDALSLIRVADRCDTTIEQARGLYLQASKILRSLARSCQGNNPVLYCKAMDLAVHAEASESAL